jgi:hypothetical protein
VTDLAATIAPKSDQMNADDLIAGPVTIQITRVSKADTAEQPIAIFFEGDGGKPYKPCKSMRRVLVQVWGKDGTTYAGRRLALYRDPEVQFGGMKVGGIRISHMSHLAEPVTMALTASKASRRPYTVKPLQAESTEDAAVKYARAFIAQLEGLSDVAAVDALENSRAAKLAELRTARPDLHSTVEAAIAQRREQLRAGAPS